MNGRRPYNMKETSSALLASDKVLRTLSLGFL